MAYETCSESESSYLTTENNNFSSQHPTTVTARPGKHPRTHSRSASWSHTSWLATNTNSASMASIFSPMRVIHGIVPTLSNSAASSTAAQRLPSPVYSTRNQSIGINNCTGTNPAHVQTRSDVSSRHSRQSSNVEIDLGDIDHAPPPSPSSPQQENNGANRAQDGMEFLGTITWVEKALPFILLLLSRIMWDHRLGILVFIGLFGTFFHVNSTIRKQVALKERRLNMVSVGIFLFLFANIFFIYYVFKNHNLEYCLILQKPNFVTMDVWTVFWCVGITDFVVRFVTMAFKCLVIVIPRRLIHFRKRGKYFLVMETISQLYRILIPIPQWYCYFTAYEIGGEYFAILSTTVYFALKCRMLFLKAKEVLLSLKSFWRNTRYGRTPAKELLIEAGDSCPICQEQMDDPIELTSCKHIFCEDCIVMWFDRERTCPMCRAEVAEDPQWRDGNTQMFIQLF